MRLNPGESVSSSRYRYTVVRQIGEGGMSAIYLCQCSAPAGSPDAGHWVLKEMTVSYRDRKDQDNAVALFLREAQLLQQLRHKNLPRVLEQFVLDRNGRVLAAADHANQDQSSLKYYTVMEFVEGEDLGKMLLRNPQGFPEARAVAWAVEIATVLYYLHSQKPPIIFRDLKPSNIMISRGQVKLIDFGIARRFDAFKKKDTVRIGSPGYAPPEQYSGQTNARSDIYALGVTLHQLLTGRDPSETQTPFKLPSVRALASAVSPATEAIVMRATELDPQARFKTALDMKRALQAVLGVQSQPLAALPSPASPTPPHAPPSMSSQTAARPLAGAPPSGGIPPRIGPPSSGIPVAGISAPTSAGSTRATNPYARPSDVVAGTSPSPFTPLAPSAQGASRAASPPSTVRPPARDGGAPSVPPPTQVAVQAAKPGTSTPPAAPPAGGSIQPQPVVGKGRRFLSRLLVVVLAALAMLAVQHREDLLPLLQWLQPSPSPLQTPGAMASPTPAASATPFPTPTPVVKVPTVTERAMILLDEGKVEAALDALEEARAAEPSNGLALIGYSNALVRAQSRDGLPADPIQAVYVDDATGNAWLRGLALAQRDVNARGGVQGHRVVIVPVAVDPARLDARTLVDVAQDRKVVAVLLDLPDALLPPVTAAYGGTHLLVLASAAQANGRPEAVGPSADGIARAMAKAIAPIKPKRVLAFRGPGAEGADTLERAVSALRPAVTVTVHPYDDQTDPSNAVASAHPNLIVFLGDARALESFAAQMQGKAPKAPVLVGPEGGVEATVGAIGDLARSGRLLVVTPYCPEARDLDQTRFAMQYRRAFAVPAEPGFAAAEGFELLSALLTSLDEPNVQWTVDGVRQAVSGRRTSVSTFSGVRLGPSPAARAQWAVLRFKNGQPTVAREVTP